MICGKCGSDKIRGTPDGYVCERCGVLLKLRLIPIADAAEWYPK